MSLTISLDLNMKKLQRGLRTTEQRLAASSKKFGEMSKNYAAKAAVATAAVGGLAFGVRKLIDAYAVQEQAEIKLNTALENTGTAANVTLEELKEYASGLQQITTFGDEAILSAQATLTTLAGKITQENLKAATETMLDFSTVMRVDAKNGALILGKVLGDPIKNTSLLSRYGISFTEQEKEKIKVMAESGKVSEAQAVILEKLNKQFGGQARAAAQGTGAIKQMDNAIGDTAEAMGKVLLPIMLDLAGPLKSMAEYIGGNEKALKTLSAGVKVLGVALAAKVVVMGTAATATALYAAKLKITAVSIKAFNLALKLMRGGLKASILTGKATARMLTGDFSRAMAIGKLSVNGLKFAVKGLIGSTGIGLLIAFLPEILQFFGGFWDDFIKLGKAGVDAFIGTFRTIKSGVKAILNLIATRDLGAFKAAMSKAWEDQKSTMSKFVTDSKKIIKESMEEKPVEAKVTVTPVIKRGIGDIGVDTPEAVEEEKEEKTGDEKREQLLLQQEEEYQAKQEHFQRLMEQDALNDEQKKEWEYELYERDKEINAKRREELDKIANNYNKRKDKEAKERSAKALALRKKSDDTDKDLSKKQSQFKLGLAMRTGRLLIDALGRDSKAAFYIQQATTLTSIAMSTAEAMTKAMALFPKTFGQPWKGYALALGIAQGALVATQQPPRAAQLGGLVTQMAGTPPIGDHQPFMLEPGELILPRGDVDLNRRASEKILNAEEEDDFFKDEEEGQISITFTDNAKDIIEAERIEQTALGYGVN